MAEGVFELFTAAVSDEDGPSGPRKGACDLRD